nr:hypothetical protein [Gemmatimonadota bacterium]
ATAPGVLPDSTPRAGDLAPSGAAIDYEPLDLKLLAFTRALPRPRDPLLGVQDRLAASRADAVAGDRGRGAAARSRADIERQREREAGLEDAAGDSVAARAGTEDLDADADDLPAGLDGPASGDALEGETDRDGTGAPGGLAPDDPFAPGTGTRDGGRPD